MKKLDIEIATFRFDVNNRKLATKVAAYLDNEGYEYEREGTLFEVYPDFDLCQLQTMIGQIEKIINN